VVVDKKQHKSQFKNSNITITQCQKNFADCVMVKFEFLNCRGLSPAILSQFAVEMCAAVKKLRKIHQKPSFEGSR